MSEKRKIEEELQESDKDEKFRFYSTIAFIIVILVIGVPMWWKTTEVYRVTLPYEEIQNLSNRPIKISLTVGIYSEDVQRSTDLIKDLTLYFKENQIFNIIFKQIRIKIPANHIPHSPAALEAIVLKQVNLSPGDFLFIEWQKLTDDVLVNSDRTAFISPTAASNKIQNVLRSWILQEHKLKSVVGSITTIDGRKLRHKSAPPQPHYDILLSVINPNPELQTVKWNVKLAAEKYIQPFLEKLENLSNFTLKSQWKYQVKFAQANKQVLDETTWGRHYALTQDHLSQIITSLEKTLGNQISNNPCIHVVFYVPPCKQAPLHIYTADGLRASTNGIDSFVSAKWGGVIILNPSKQTCLSAEETDQPVEVSIKSSVAMEITLYLLRKIFDMESNQPIPGVNLTQYEAIEPRAWEIDTYLRSGCIHLIHTAQSTLLSLVQLLNGISYIVINDQVGFEIKKSYENIVLAKIALEQSRIQDAVSYAKAAYVSAEAAFFDPSLLALLYFPDEQKYAIYIPLFLPIMIPVLLSILSLKKFFVRPKTSAEHPKTE